MVGWVVGGAGGGPRRLGGSEDRHCSCSGELSAGWGKGRQRELQRVQGEHVDGGGIEPEAEHLAGDNDGARRRTKLHSLLCSTCKERRGERRGIGPICASTGGLLALAACMQGAIGHVARPHVRVRACRRTGRHDSWPIFF
jgi:hypothetical protein